MMFFFTVLTSAFASTPEPHSADVYDDGLIALDLQDDITPQELNQLFIDAGLTDPQLVSLDDEEIWTGHSVDPARSLSLLTGNSNVEVAEPVIYLSHDGLIDGEPTSDPDYKKQWHMKNAGAEYVWTKTKAGAGTIVAILDTGFTVTKDFEPGHVDTANGKSFVPNESVRDGHGHGSHCAATVAQWTNNGFAFSGLAPETTILPVKVLSDAGMGASPWIASGIDYASDVIQKSGKPGVISMSLGSGAESSVISRAIDRALAKGVVVVAASGNSGGPHDHWPASYPPVISVGSVGPDDKRAPYSSYGTQLDIMDRGGNKQIPGGGVHQWITFQNKESAQEWQGTSMATPHAAASVAVLLGEGACKKSKGVDVQTCVEKLLKATATPGPNQQQYAAGIINLPKAVQTAAQQEDTASVPVQDEFSTPDYTPDAYTAQVQLPHAPKTGPMTPFLTLITVAAVLGLARLYSFSRSALAITLAVAVAATAPLYVVSQLVPTGLSVLVVPWIEIGDYVFGRWFSSNPLIQSFLPLTLPFLLGVPFRTTFPWVMGLLVSTAVYLTANTFLAFNPVLHLSPFAAALWLGINSLIVIGMTFFGARFQERMS